jgi:prepilin-type processing-associated H-X9-DG protein
MSEIPSPRLSGTALVSLLLGLTSPLLQVLTGLPAMVLGLRALRAVNASEGRLQGARLAVGGMILGALGTALTGLWLGMIVIRHVNEKSNRVQCMDNLRQIGLAMNLYSVKHDGLLPPATVPARWPPEKRLSWQAALLPFLEELAPGNPKWKGLSEKIDYQRPWDDSVNAKFVQTNVLRFLCRSHPQFDPQGSPGWTHYVGLAGIDPDAALLPKDNPRAGYIGHDRTISLEDLKAGISYTMTVTETTSKNGRWAAGGSPTVRGLDPHETAFTGPGRALGGCHPGGLNVLWADMSVRWVADTVPPDDFRAQATLSGREE